MQQLGLEVIETKTLVVVVPCAGQGVRGIVKRAAHAPGDVKRARHAEHAEGVEAVGVLKDFRFQGDGSDVRRKTVGLNDVGNGSYPGLWPVQLAQEGHGFFCRQPRGL
ncbi:hypothetical protein D3C71_1671180 [compost metagenome]